MGLRGHFLQITDKCGICRSFVAFFALSMHDFSYLCTLINIKTTNDDTKTNKYAQSITHAPAHPHPRRSVGTGMGGDWKRSGFDEKVKTDGSGTATFAVGVLGGIDIKRISLRVDGNAINLPSSKKLEAGHIYNITRRPVPEGAISGKFTINGNGDKVFFAKGNLQATTYYGIYNSTYADNYGYSDFKDWGPTMGSGWRTPSVDEWNYVLKTRSASTVNGTAHGRFAKATVADKAGLIIFPDWYKHPDGVTRPRNVNIDNCDYNVNTYDATAWSEMEDAGCVFLPAAGYSNVDTEGVWVSRHYGYSVRLIHAVE